MEKTIKARFVTDFYGSAPALGAQAILEKYVEGEIDKAFLSFLDGIKKKGKTAADKAAEILSVFHRDDEGRPVLGNWMLKRCMVLTGEAIFNALKDKTHPKKTVIRNAIVYIEPIPFIGLTNGKRIAVPNGVRTYTVSIGSRSFFKAYEWIARGATFEATIAWDANMLSEEHMGQILRTSGRFGVGAFRERYGKFEMLD